MLERYKCLRCKHEWIPRSDEKPKVCPHCHSPYWDRERVLRFRNIKVGE
jgi:DNA-directed RNA polymerase subunit RPC12/RpoP